MTATQRAVVDDLGNINVHGRSALELVWKVKDADGNLVNISASDLFFEIDTKLRIELTAGEDNYSRKLTLSRAQIATLPLNQPLQYALHDETPSSPATIWNGRVTAYGFRTAPSGAAAVDPGVASWTGATVIVQQGESVPTVVVTYMGATGYGMPSGGTVGQYIRKSSSTPYDVAWDTVTGSDVGLGNVDNTSDANKPVSTAQQAALDLKLNLAGGTLSGVLAFIAGTAALPGLAVAGDLNTGIYGVSADVLGVSAGGLNAASFSNGQLSLATAAGGAGVNLAVDGANALALRSGANAQAFRVYNTYTDVSNYEMGHIAWQSNEFRIGTLRAGTGTGRDLVFQTNGSSRWYIASSGNLLASADNTYDFGASGANRVRNLYVADSVFSGGFRFPSSTRLSSLSDGGLRISNNAISNFAILEAEAANTLALRNGNNTQTLNLYRLTDGTNLERLSVYYSSGFNILTEAAGTGVVRDMRIGAGAGGGLYLRGGGTDRWVLYSTGVLNPAADATYDLGSSSLQIRDAYLSRYLRIGGAAPAGAANISAIQAFGQTFGLLVSDVLTDATDKNGRIGSLHYTTSEEPVIALYVSSVSANTQLQIGGGTSAGNAVTQIGFFTAANTTTLTGTRRWKIDTSGHFLAEADNTYDIGAAGANRARNIYAANAFVAGGGIDAGSRVYIYTGTAIPAGGTTGAGYRMSSTANFGVFFGAGAPTLSAAKGSLYLRSDGSGTGDRMYVNTDGATAWTAVTTAA